MRSIKPTENDIQKLILEWLTLRGIFHWRQNSGSFKRGNHFYKMCSISGVPDIVCIHNGKFIGIEVKKEGGKQRVSQKLFEDKCKKAGGVYLLAFSLDDVINGFTWK